MKVRHLIQAPTAALLIAGATGLCAQSSGGTTFTPTGFLSVTGVSRSTNTGSNLPTGFGSIPYNNQIQGNIGETRFSAADTTLGLKTATMFGSVKVNGYAAIDFLGNDAANAYVTTNSHTARLRLAYLDVFAGDWEIMGGQAYSWMTPNRVGLSADVSDVFITRNVDPNYQVGMVWTRAAQIRFAYHPSSEWAFGLAFESPDQYVGAGEVIFPFAFNAQLGTQVDAGNNLATPNQFPDIIAKVAFDSAGHAIHVEAAGLYRKFQVTTLDIGASDFSSKSATGSGFSLNANIELFSGFRVIANGYMSNGGGRYIAGLGPDFVVEPNAAANSVSLSTVKSSAFLGGFEWQVNADNLIAAYYGADSFQRNAFQDTTSPLVTKPFIGFGGTNSPNSANRMIREYSLDYHHTLWSEPGKGAVKTLFQVSHLNREPGYVAPGAPPKTQTNMLFASLRYIFP